jgi:hypothetical protein
MTIIARDRTKADVADLYRSPIDRNQVTPSPRLIPGQNPEIMVQGGLRISRRWDWAARSGKWTSLLTRRAGLVHIAAYEPGWFILQSNRITRPIERHVARAGKEEMG